MMNAMAAGADVNWSNPLVCLHVLVLIVQDEGITPLILCIIENYFESFVFLIESCRADVNYPENVRHRV